MNDRVKENISLAVLGKQVLSNSVYQSSFESIQAKIFNDFCHSKADETEKRNEAWRQMQVLIEMRAYFNHLLKSGKSAEERLKAQEEHDKWLKAKGKYPTKVA